MFICHCVAHRVSVYCCIAVCMGLSTGPCMGHGCSIRANFCSFSVMCDSPAVYAGVFMAVYG